MFETENHRRIIRRFYLINHPKGSFASAGNPFRRENDLVISGLNVTRRQWSPVVKFDAFAETECGRQAVSRERPALGNIADDFRIVLRIEAEQRAVMRALPDVACRKLFRDVRQTTVEVRRRQRQAPLPSAAVARTDSRPLGLTPAMRIKLQQSLTRFVA